MATILIPSLLRQHTAYQDTVSFSGNTVGEVIQNLIATYPKLSPYLTDLSGGSLNIYLSKTNIRFLSGENTPLSDTDILTIVPALAGG